jgi:ppGpp synthetase/RelA/SpoT-type nucleotidyltranferase
MPKNNKDDAIKPSETILESYSRTSIGRAGEILVNCTNKIGRDTPEYLEAHKALSYWRACHIAPMDEAFSELAAVTLADKTVILAKRLKRTPSIITKLVRHKGMQLQNMQDIGGCRAILRTHKHVSKINRALKRRWAYREKDYISNPKDDGYRGIHLIGKFNGEDKKSVHTIEIQLRTEIQHAWATAVEIIDLFTNQKLKNNLGKPVWRDFFIDASTALAELDGAEIDPDELRTAYSGVDRLSQRLKVFEKFNAYNSSLRVLEERGVKGVEGYYLLQINTQASTLSYDFYPVTEDTLANKKYLELERNVGDQSDIVVALVSTLSLASLKEAYPNYFADARKFVELLEKIIARNRVVNPSWILKFFMDFTGKKNPLR